MSGFDINRFIDLTEREAKHLICCICMNVFNNAVRSECEHIFCKNCVQQWIESDHKDCPQCRTEFATRKRSNTTRNDNNLVIIRNYLFKKCLLINNLINEMLIKCEFEFNGCQQPIKLSEYSVHIRECENRICNNCGFTFGKPEEHNCIELLKKNRDEWKEKFDNQLETNDKLKQEICGLKTNQTTNEQKMIELKASDEQHLQDINQLKGVILRLDSQLKSKEKESNEWKEKCDKQLKINDKLKQEICDLKTKVTTNEQKVIELSEQHLQDINQLTKLEIDLESKEKKIIEIRKDFSLNNDNEKIVFKNTLKNVIEYCESSQSVSNINHKEEVQHYLSAFLSLAQYLYPYISPMIYFGNYEIFGYKVQIQKNGITFTPNEKIITHFKTLDLPFKQLKRVMYYRESYSNAIILKTNKQTCDSFRRLLGLGDTSLEGFVFDINSNVPKHRYITMNFYLETETFECYLRCLHLCEPQLKIQEKSRKQIFENIQK